MKNIIFILAILFAVSANAQNDLAERDSIVKVFQKVITLQDVFFKAVERNDMAVIDKARSQLESYFEDHYDAILPKLVKLVCGTKDVGLFSVFLKVLISTENSADEEPSYRLAEIYACQPDFTLKLIDKCSNKKIVLDDLSFGFLNIPMEKQKKIKNYEQLKEGLEKELRNLR